MCPDEINRKQLKELGKKQNSGFNNRIYVGWEGGYFIVSTHQNFQESLEEMIQDLGPPTIVEYRSASEGYVTTI